jgi:cell division septation protein DedD
LLEHEPKEGLAAAEKLLERDQLPDEGRSALDYLKDRATDEMTAAAEAAKAAAEPAAAPTPLAPPPVKSSPGKSKAPTKAPKKPGRVGS